MDHNPASKPKRTTTQSIKDLILARGLHPGDPMPSETELMELLGVSRSNLREAVRTLVALDILQVRHGTGTFVGEFSMRPFVEALAFRGLLMPGDDFEALRQVIEVRTALDFALASTVVEKLAGGKAEGLYAHCDEMIAASERGESFTAADRAFHLGLANHLSNELYGELVAAFWDIHGIVGPRLGVPTPQDIQETAAAHRDMLDAAVAGDLTGYLTAVGAHYAPLMRVLDQARR